MAMDTIIIIVVAGIRTPCMLSLGVVPQSASLDGGIGDHPGKLAVFASDGFKEIIQAEKLEADSILEHLFEVSVISLPPYPDPYLVSPLVSPQP